MTTQPIGVLDSGVGGLTILSHIRKALPSESTIYIGDSKNAPYGKRSQEEIITLASKMVQFLLSRQVKLIVIACNTITVNGIDVLRKQFPQVPLIGTVPVVKTAASITRKKRIGILVTEATAKSSYNQHLIDTFASDCEVVTIGTNKLVPLIESEKNDLLPEVIATELAPFKESAVDVVVLGSTHFPILRPFLVDFLGSEVSLLDSGGAVARQTKRILTNNNALNHEGGVQHKLYTTGAKDPFSQIAQQVLGGEEAVQVVMLESGGNRVQ